MKPPPVALPPEDGEGGVEYLPVPDLTPDEVATFDEARRVLGVTERELVAIGGAWWDRTGRHLIRAPEWRNPDAGLPSRITRGLPFAELTPIERQRVTIACWLHKIVPALQAGQPLDPLHRGA
jgi:hypothetical protein